MRTQTENELHEAKARYYLPNSWGEIDRMRNQHEWVKGCAGGLIKAPIDYAANGFRVMDSATADGYWIYDVRPLFPSDTEFIGFDIAGDLFPVPELRPQTVTLEVHDLLKPFPIAWQQSFDLVHQRFIFPIFKDSEVNQVVENLVSCVKPGGWIQFVEPDASTKLSESKATWFLKLHNLAEKVMTNPNVAQKLKSRLGELGMSNIQEEVIDMGVGRLHENRELGIRGAKNMKAMLDRFMSVTGHEALCLTEEQWEKLPVEFENDMDRYKTSLRHHFIWAQKPSAGL